MKVDTTLRHDFDPSRTQARLATVTGERGASVMKRQTHGILTILLTVTCLLLAEPNVQAADRVERGLLARYDFRESDGQTVHDRSGVGKPLDLVIDKSSRVRWSKGTLVVEASSSIASAHPATKIIDAVKKSNAISIEAWLKPANTSQGGPARIVSISADTSNRNVTLGQEKNFYDVRLRATGSDNNGLPSTSSPKRSLQTKLTHVVFTRDAKGKAIVYVDGKQVASKSVKGNFGNWDNRHRLFLANEATKDRAWLGELQLVAIYDRALSDKDVKQNFAAGSQAERALPTTEKVVQSQGLVFDRHVAPLFAKHCLECHDAAIKKGELDLSHKTSALAGGESGKVIVPGKSAESLLWESVSSNEMPKDRPPLSAEEKASLRKWLDEGAAWPVEAIDPAIYLNEGHAGEVWLQRLTVPEYIATVRSAVGVDIEKEARKMLPPDLRADGFSNTAYNLNIDLKHVEAYNKLAEIIVSRMDMLKFARRFSKSQKAFDRRHDARSRRCDGKMVAARTAGCPGNQQVQRHCDDGGQCGRRFQGSDQLHRRSHAAVASVCVPHRAPAG